jgi:hypothetical protein
MMNHTLKRVGLLCGLALLATGCVQRAPFLESQMGLSVSLIKAQQTLNPEASRNTDPVAGMDGKAAKSGYDHYQRSFKTPEPQPNAFTIGIGGGR